MFRRRLIHPCLVLASLGTGCAKDLDLDPNPPSPDNLGAVVAQFDPSNPVGVLQLIPSPTSLAELPDGTINKAAVAPEPCELPTRAQCLQFVDGWPLATPITLYFSGLVDPQSVLDGVSLYEVGAAGVEEVDLAFANPADPTPARAAPPPACERSATGGVRYTSGMCEAGSQVPCVPPGIEVTLVPTRPLKPKTRYLLKVESTATGGVRDVNGNRVDPSALFSLLNVDEDVAPVQTDGIITSGLLRSQVQGTILRTADVDMDGALDFEGEDLKTLDAEQRAVFDQLMVSSGLRLRGLYDFFNGLAGQLMMLQLLENRDDAVFLNTWTSGGETLLEFDPANDKFPFPNGPLLTRTATPGQTFVMLPPNDADGDMLPDVNFCTRGLCEVFGNACQSDGDCESDPDDDNDSMPDTVDTDDDGDGVIDPFDSFDALRRGINTLDGFSNTSSIAITFTRELDVTTLEANIQVRILDEDGLASGDPIPMWLTYTSSSAFGPPRVTLRPVMPLLQDQLYVVIAKKGILDADGNPVGPSSTFQILRDVPEPFTSTPIPTKAEQGFQCSTVPITGMLADPTTVQGLAARLEVSANHPEWTASIRAVEMATSNPIPKEELLIAFTYKTQSITPTVDAAKNILLPNVWEMIDGGPRVVGPVFTATGSAQIAELIGVVPRFCVAFCEAGAMADIPPNMCAERDAMGNIITINPDVVTNLVCQLAHQVITGNLGEANLYLLRGYQVTAGSPFSAGTFTPATVTTPELINIPFWVVTSANPQPAGGYPAAIFQHGLGGEKEQGFLIANTLANTGDGWATILMDFPFHGDRASDIIMNTTGVPCTDATGSPNIDPRDVVCDPNTGMCQSGCDGLQDPSATGLLSPNLFGVRDNFRQGTIDQLTLLRTIQAEGQAGGLLAQLDGTRVGYIGQSLGGIAGGNFAAYVRPDEVEAVVLNVGGGSLTEVVLGTVPQISGPLFAALQRSGVCELEDGKCLPTETFRQFLTIAQWVLDPGDPHGTSVGVMYDRTLLTPGGPVTIPSFGPENVLIQMSLPDPVVPNTASLLLGLAYGFDVDLDAKTSADEHFTIYDFRALPQAQSGSGCHGFLLAPTCGMINPNGTPNLADVICNTVGAQQQAAGFLESSGTVVPPNRPAQVSGIPCP